MTGPDRAAAPGPVRHPPAGRTARLLTSSRPRLEALVAAVLGTALAVRVGTVDPNLPGRYPRCPFLSLTGLPCPGCGSLRALHDLLHGDLLSALGHNALFVVTLAVAAVRCGATFRLRHPPRRPTPRLSYAVVAVLAAWTLARVLPLDALSALGP